MNLNTVKSETFISAFDTWWPTWKNQINRFETIQEWWEVTKAKIQCLTIDISKQINKGKNKSNIKNLEKKLEYIKSNNENNIGTNNKIEEIERTINNYYTNRTEAAKIRSKIKWTEEGEKSTRYFFDIEKKCGQDKLWNRIKTSEGHYKYDIDSIINEQVKFQSKLFTSEGWNNTCGRNLTQHLQEKLTIEEKGELDSDVDSNEIVKVLKVLKSNKSPGEDGIISEFY